MNLFKEIFGFSCPGFEAAEELERLREYSYDLYKKELQKKEREMATKKKIKR